MCLIILVNLFNMYLSFVLLRWFTDFTCLSGLSKTYKIIQNSAYPYNKNHKTKFDIEFANDTATRDTYRWLHALCALPHRIHVPVWLFLLTN